MFLNRFFLNYGRVVQKQPRATGRERSSFGANELGSPRYVRHRQRYSDVLRNKMADETDELVCSVLLDKKYDFVVRILELQLK